MFCPNCGKEIEKNANFCMYCGKKMEPSKEIPIESIDQKQEYNSDHLEEKHKKKRKKIPKWAMITCISVFALTVSSLVFFLFFRSSSQDLERTKQISSINEPENPNSDVDSDVDSNVNSNVNSDVDSEDSNTETNSEPEPAEPVAEEPINPNAENLNLEIKQVDNQNYPDLTFYASINNQNDQTIQQIDKDHFMLFEEDRNGQKTAVVIDDFYQVSSKESISISLVLDKSFSMDSTEGESGLNSYMTQAKNAAKNFLKKVRFDKGHLVSITCFSDFVSLMHDFSGNLTSLSNTIDQIRTDGITALYDALYSSILNIYPQPGAKCVIAFTDGEENASSYTFEDVVNLSRRTGIPVHIIGIGEDCDSDSLSSLASLCSGKYFNISTNQIEDFLEKIYLDIYNNQEDLYVIKYTSPIKDDPQSEREIVFTARGSKGYNGRAEKLYVPVPILSDAFGAYQNNDFIIENSNTVLIEKSRLKNLSLSQLRIARNEIYARHGRLFQDPILNKWFYSKKWYLDLEEKYLPENFSSSLSKIELQNIDIIKKQEDDILSFGEIYPDSDTILLTEYDLYLSKNNLQTALTQMKKNPNKTDILSENIKIVQDALQQ